MKVRNGQLAGNPGVLFWQPLDRPAGQPTKPTRWFIGVDGTPHAPALAPDLGPPITFDPALVGVLRRLIDHNELRNQRGEDTIGVLMKCGAFHESPAEGFVAQLAQAIEAKS